MPRVPFWRNIRNPDEVVFSTYPKFLFAWPIIMMGYLLWPVEGWGGKSLP